ncbi:MULTISPECIES: N-acetylmuramidase domain-containing protein [unclassified Novosphingobium]|uniref:N-acetylmuramidase domain-containing protein n=1 Tax=unclassified Novosphingobium TaxID=2644732 RepID=UPI001357E077|nr:MULTISPECIES: N-acetylmuramidase domain-containing protein [unclassified Novosphingobium]
MDVRKLQTTLGVKADGLFGPISREALRSRFTNINAPAVNAADMTAFASRLGCSLKQMRAVSAVESGGAAYDKNGRPKILFERHLFHRQTEGKFSPAAFSQAQAGGYSEDSWDKLGAACSKDPDAAFASCSWGKFQVLGLHWSKLGYVGPYELAFSTVAEEAAHYELLARYIEAFGLTDELRSLSGDPDDCRAFARAYNGTGYERYSYHTKLAAAMA